MSERTSSEQSAIRSIGEPCIVVTIAVAREGRVLEETRERVVATSIGAALDAYACDPAKGSCFAIRIEGRGCRV